MESFINPYVFGMLQMPTGNLFMDAVLAGYYKVAALFYLWLRNSCIAAVKSFLGYAKDYQP